MAILIDGFEIDAAVNEEHAFESDVTAHPVESGADVTDHVRARPISVTIEGVVSDTPFSDLAHRRGDSGPPSDDALARLLLLREEREPVTIRTSLREYENMVLESLSIPRSGTTGAALRFSASFREIRLVTSERTTVHVDLPRAKKKVNLGTKPAPESATAVINYNGKQVTMDPAYFTPSPSVTSSSSTLTGPPGMGRNGRIPIAAGTF